MITQGRTQILSPYTMEDIKKPEFLIKAINLAMRTHIANATEIEYLFSYFKGVQPILNKKTITRPEINNIVLVNYAQMITRTIVNYFVGTPIQYTQSGYGSMEDDEATRQEVEKLNLMLDYGNSSSVDLEIAETQSVCGTAYRIIFTDNNEDLPFKDRHLNPLTTFVVYSNTLEETPLMGVTYTKKIGENGLQEGCMFEVFTSFGVFNINSNSEFIQESDKITFVPYNVGGVPLIEYPNNRHRMGDWEFVISIMDAISNLYSDRIDDIQQTVQSLLVFINAELEPNQFEEMRQKGIISLVNNNDNNRSEIKSISNQLDQKGTGGLSKELQDLLFSLVGIPNRDNRATGGGDTGTAVELRDGWADLENVIRSKELYFKKGERKKLEIITTILKNKKAFNITSKDLVVKFSRNKHNNLLVKTQSLTNMLQTKTISPIDALQIADLTTDATDVSTRGKVFWQREFANKTPEEYFDAQLNQFNQEEPLSAENSEITKEKKVKENTKNK